jgi:hypothetical protein
LLTEHGLGGAGVKVLEAIAKPVFIVILNEVEDLKSLKMRDSSLRSE